MSTLSRQSTAIDLTGKRFGKWSVLRFAGLGFEIGKGSNGSYWLCRCSCCGRELPVSLSMLRSGRSLSCGHRDGRKKHPLYETWCQIRRRCESPKCRAYASYGGRGIKLCKRWSEDFWAFVDDMGDRPEGMTIDRIDNDGDYTPENCRWATKRKQGQNKRNNKTITVNGVTKCYSEWARSLGMSQSIIDARLRAGWCEVCTVTVEKNGSCPHKQNETEAEDVNA